MLSAIAAVIYLVIAALCLHAALVAGRRPAPQPRGRTVWLAIAALFVVLAASRLTNLEEELRSALRLWLVAEGQYEQRQALQGPLTAALFVIAGVAAMWLWTRPAPPRRDRQARALVWAKRGSWAMIGLVALRMVSFHPTDMLLYRARLNWVLDPGLAILVGLCAWRFARAPGSRRGAPA